MAHSAHDYGTAMVRGPVQGSGRHGPVHRTRGEHATVCTSRLAGGASGAPRQRTYAYMGHGRDEYVMSNEYDPSDDFASDM